jgi:hypothetical protein
MDDILHLIVVHNIDIINSFEKNEKYKPFKHYKYVLVGKHENDFSSEKIIQCNKFSDNIEHNKNYLAYTGWYVIAKHLDILIPNNFKYVFLLEYDVCLNKPDKLDYIYENVYKNNRKLYGISHMSLDYIVKSDIHNSILLNYLRDKQIKELRTFKNKLCLATNNIIFERGFLVDFFNNSFTLDFLKYLNNDIMSGHNLERFLSVYCFINNVEYDIFCEEEIFYHDSLDSHNTQGRYNRYNQFKIQNNIL